MAPPTLQPHEVKSRLLTWLAAQGIELTETVIRHVSGIVKALEKTTTKH